MSAPLVQESYPENLDPAQQWRVENLIRLSLQVSHMRDGLEYYLALAQGQPATPPPGFSVQSDDTMEPPALNHLSQILGLSPFERRMLVLVLATELDPQIGQLCGQVQGNTSFTFATAHLATKILPGASWGSFLPEAPLLYWSLIRMDPSPIFTLSPLRIDPCILLYLMGEPLIDGQLQDLIQPLSGSRFAEVAPSQQRLMEQIQSVWLAADPSGADLPIIQICCREFSTTQPLMAEIGARLRRPVYRVSLAKLASLPGMLADGSKLPQILRRWERIAYLTGAILVLDCYDFIPEGSSAQLFQQILFSLHSPAVLATENKIFLRDRQVITFDLPDLSPQEQYYTWKHHLGPTLAGCLGDRLDPITAHFNLNTIAIASICRQLKAGRLDAEEHSISSEDLFRQAWWTSRQQARPRLDALAQRIETQLTWSDLILPESQLNTLQTIISHTQQRAKVYQTWGWQRRSGRGLGISALFHGQSGTGKTTAAEIIAKELDLDLYRVDLSAVVSKYIGETEKNLSQIFNAAEAGGVVLLFDEADALFGKRGEVREARDRYANQEVSYLLQRMEAYSGLAILTTNLKSSMDKAFERRLRFVVEFPFPDTLQREQLWRRVFPKDTPVQDLDYGRLARLNVSGGVIRNIALGATFIAAEANESVGMHHLVLAARSEGVKSNITQVIEAGIKGWVRAPL